MPAELSPFIFIVDYSTHFLEFFRRYFANEYIISII